MEYRIESHAGDVALVLAGDLDAIRESDHDWLQLADELRWALRQAGGTLFVDYRSLDQATTRGLHTLRSVLELACEDTPFVHVGPGRGLDRLSELGTSSASLEFVDELPWDVRSADHDAAEDIARDETGEEKAIHDEVADLLSAVFPSEAEHLDKTAVAPLNVSGEADPRPSSSTVQPSTPRSNPIEEFVIDLDLERLYLEHQSDSRELKRVENDQTLIFGKDWKPIAPRPRPAKPRPAPSRPVTLTSAADPFASTMLFEDSEELASEVTEEEQLDRGVAEDVEVSSSKSAEPTEEQAPVSLPDFHADPSLRVTKLSEMRDAWDELQHEFELTESRTVQLLTLVRTLIAERHEIVESIGAQLDEEREGPRGNRWCATLITLSTLTREGTDEPTLTAMLRSVVLAGCAEHRHWRPRLGWCHDGLEHGTRNSMSVFSDVAIHDVTRIVDEATSLWRAAVAVTAGRALGGPAWPEALVRARRYLDGRHDAQVALGRIVRAHGKYLPGTWVELSSGEIGVVQSTEEPGASTVVWVVFRGGRAATPRLFPGDGDAGVGILGAITPPRVMPGEPATSAHRLESLRQFDGHG